MSMKLTGTIKRVFDQETKGSFTFRNLWIEHADNPQYPQVTEVQFSQAKCGLLDSVNAGDTVEIDINLRGRITTYNGNEKVWNTIEGWRVSVTSKAEPVKQQGKQQEWPAEVPDDLPF